MDELTSTWLNDPDASAVKRRLDELDREAWAQNAKKMSKVAMREVLSNTIDDEVDKFYEEKAEENKFIPPPEKKLNINDDGMNPFAE